MTETPQKDPTCELASIRDWLRWGVTQFERAGVVYGHGTDNAVDEAAFLILSSLNLPIDDIASWLDCRLTQPERNALRDLIEARIATRKPAAYLTKSAWIRGYKFYVDERAIIPRSYIGELLLRDGLASLIDEADAISNVLDLCTGSGCLAILAAHAFPNAVVTAIDVSEDALDVARTNVATYELQDRITLLRSDLFDAIPQQRFDLILEHDHH